MTLFGFLILLLIAMVCGALAEALVGFSAGGCLFSAGVGLIGAYVGSWLAARFGLPPVFVVDVGGFEMDIIWTILGSAALLLPFALIRGAFRRT